MKMRIVYLFWINLALIFASGVLSLAQVVVSEAERHSRGDYWKLATFASARFGRTQAPQKQSMAGCLPVVLLFILRLA